MRRGRRGGREGGGEGVQAMECDDALSHDLDLRCSNQHYKGLGTSYNNRIVKMKEGGGGHNIGDVF